MNSQIAVDSGTTNTDENAEIPAGPSRCLGMTVGAVFVVFLLQHIQQDRLQSVLLFLFRIRLLHHLLVL